MGLWVAVVVLVVLVLGVAYYYYYYNYIPAPSDTTGQNVPTEEELASGLDSLKLDDLELELGDIEKELVQ